jgi:hypothetical protein
MAGTLTISTLSDGTNSTSSTNCIQGSAKAWVNFTGSTGAVVSSYNVSSITRSGTGIYQVNMTNALSDNKYIAVGNTSSDASNRAPNAIGMFINSSNVYTAPTTSTFVMYTINYNGSAIIDPVYLGISVFR